VCSLLEGQQKGFNIMFIEFRDEPKSTVDKNNTEIINKKLSYHKETVQLLHNIEIRILLNRRNQPVKLPNSAKKRKITVITPFKVIEGH